MKKAFETERVAGKYMSDKMRKRAIEFAKGLTDTKHPHDNPIYNLGVQFLAEVEAREKAEAGIKIFNQALAVSSDREEKLHTQLEELRARWSFAECPGCHTNVLRAAGDKLAKMVFDGEVKLRELEALIAEKDALIQQGMSEMSVCTAEDARANMKFVKAFYLKRKTSEY